MNATSKWLWLIFLAGVFVAGCMIGSAMQTIFSPKVTVNVEDYALSLDVNATNCMVGDTVKFSGSLTSESYVFSDCNITLYCNDTYTGFWTLTDSNGCYEFVYQVTTKGTFDFDTKTTI